MNGVVGDRPNSCVVYMNLFKREAAPDEAVVTGIDVLRKTCKARDTKAGALWPWFARPTGLALPRWKTSPPARPISVSSCCRSCESFVPVLRI